MLSSGIAESSPTAAREPAVLAGFLSRKLLDRQAADLERITEQHTRLPEELLIRDRVPADLIGTLGQAESIPLLDMSGREIRAWTSAEFLAAFSSYQTRLKERLGEEAAAEEQAVTEEQAAAQTAAAGGDWLSRMVLGGFPHPLFASDLEGKTLFYNEAFEGGVLAQPTLKNSLRVAEKYFLELTRELLARSLQTGPNRDGTPLRTRLPHMQLGVEVATLEKDGRVMGYLYIFRDLVWTGLQYELQDMLAAGQGLDDIIDEIESALIYSALKHQGQNISHAAQMLKVKRSTLQNKMKRLKIDEKYDRRVEGPIRRKRRATGATPEVHDAPPVDLPAGQSPKSASKKPPKKGAAKKSARSSAKSAARSKKTTSKKAPAKKAAKKKRK